VKQNRFFTYLLNLTIISISNSGEFNIARNQDLTRFSLSFAERAIFGTSRSLRVPENRGEGSMSIGVRLSPST
jgi:hypothetical protein